MCVSCASMGTAVAVTPAAAAKAFLPHLLAVSALAVVAFFPLVRGSSSSAEKHGNELLSKNEQVWPELVFSWRIVVATLIGFVGSACGTVGGVGGGGIFVAMLNLIVGFDTKSAAALSKCMIMGASMSSVWYNVRVSHPTKDVPIIDYDLALLFQPMLMLGITIGVSLSVVFPYWLITVLIVILFSSTSSRSFFRGVLMWKEETLTKMELERKEQEDDAKGDGDDVIIDAEYEPLLPREEKSALQILVSNINCIGVTVLMIVWFCFLVLQIIKNNSGTCSPTFWVVNILQVPVAVSVFMWEAAKLYMESQRRRKVGNSDSVCEASIEWSVAQLSLCALCGILGGTVGGLLGSGGGFILGPLLLEIGVIPQVASATATFVMMFSSSLSVVEFYFLHRFPIPYAVYLTSVSVLAGFWGQSVVRKVVATLKRASIIVFILSSVIFASALIMGIVGVNTSVDMIKHHEYMGFLSFCET